MHQDLEKLINLAKESGQLTEKQKEIILRKAEKIDEDVDEVEMVLESLSQKIRDNAIPKSKSHTRKCPSCGAIIPSGTLKCPECGFLLEDESEAAREARLFLEQLQMQLNRWDKVEEDDENDDPLDIEKKKASIIQGATIPNTIEGYLQMLTFAYSNYLSSGRDGDGRPLVKNAWLGKAKHAYSQLLLRAKEDESLNPIIDNYAFVLKEKPAKSYTLYIVLGIIIPLALLFYYIIKYV